MKIVALAKYIAECLFEVWPAAFTLPNSASFAIRDSQLVFPRATIDYWSTNSKESRQMKFWKTVLCLVLTLNIAVFAAAAPRTGQRPAHASDPNELPKQIRRFAPTVLTANTAQLSPKDRLALRKIIA